MEIQKATISNYFRTLQDSICKQLEAADGIGRFQEETWSREGGGGGRTRIIEGAVIEKGGVNFSEVYGEMPASVAKGLEMEGGDFYATGVSIVLHPINPRVPIIHMNVRYFESNQKDWWFGGGIDLTPHYVDENDARFFHQSLKQVCDQFDTDFYPKFKNWADDYFFIKHRQETRGIGGIFFDRLMGEAPDVKAQYFDFVQAVGNVFAPIYVHFMNKNKAMPFGEREKKWQLLRRGRYVEFNLVWDRGTKFGLQTDGRTESILMSLPPQANWMYQHQPEHQSEEAHTLDMLKKGIDWLNF